MGKLIDVNEVKKRYPIMENDFGMVINEGLHKELDKIPTVEAISKADMVTILDKIKEEIMQLYYEVEVVDYDHNDVSRIKKAHWITREEVLQIIDKYRGEEDGKID